MTAPVRVRDRAGYVLLEFDGADSILAERRRHSVILRTQEALEVAAQILAIADRAVQREALMHPRGACTCYGEGRCAWCLECES